MGLSGILRVTRPAAANFGRDAPAVYGAHKTRDSRCARWSQLGLFARMFRDLARPGAAGDTIMMDRIMMDRIMMDRIMMDRMDGTHLTARRTAASLSKGARPRAIGRNARIGKRSGGSFPRARAGGTRRRIWSAMVAGDR
jgi:hypothetical protein